MRSAVQGAAQGHDGHGHRRPLGPADVELLQQLADLRDRGALTDEEFTAEKDLILPRDAP
jgi:hypothetical protein